MDKMRWRYGDTNPVVAAVWAPTVIEIGDLVYLIGSGTKAVNDYLDEASMTPRKLKKRFLGVAMQRSVLGGTDPIRVATTGVFEFECPKGSYELGDLMGILKNQSVVRVSKRKNAIGRVARRAPFGTAEVLVDIRSTVMTGGI